ncbi:unnamed protein product [Porites evermanni]|uniref:GAIN-B domain-containing protein n=1 Tax=Porites evermanni TaxID=104178 RepID=A0ABN8M3B0_9CNID|nr:unnamed protein product [Porites evermanni]
MFPRTTIVSSTVEPRPLDDLKNPVKIILQNRKVLPRAVTSKETHCVFWRPKEPPAMWKTSGCQLVRSQSNASITTCECDHLTVFAALMDPYGLNTTLPHKQALEIISIIGCSISLFSVLLTMAVTLVFWREIKGSRVKVLLNLCAAIACSCILAILEGSARNKEPIYFVTIRQLVWLTGHYLIIYRSIFKEMNSAANLVVCKQRNWQRVSMGLITDRRKTAKTLVEGSVFGVFLRNLGQGISVAYLRKKTCSDQVTRHALAARN